MHPRLISHGNFHRERSSRTSFYTSLVSSHSYFIYRVKDLRSSLIDLLIKNVEIYRTDKCKSVFQQAKELPKSDRLLLHFDPNLPKVMIVSADASQKGIGGVLMHRRFDENNHSLSQNFDSNRSAVPSNGERKPGGAHRPEVS